ncbi:MAG: ABC transporter ATP-binding protein [Bacillota bacterium]
MQPVLRLRGIHKTYDMGDVKVHALRGVDLVIQRGELVAIMGPSGSGKSTLMHIIGCLDRPTEGEYYLEGENVAEKTDDQLAELRNRHLGFVFQEFNLLPSMTALENVSLPLTYRGVPAGQRAKIARGALERVGLGERTRHRPNQLSGGQKQRVAIARSLATEPAILLADEPTGNLDTSAQRDIMGILEELNDTGITVVVVTHDPTVASHCRRIVRLLDGDVIEDGAVEVVEGMSRESG